MVEWNFSLSQKLHSIVITFTVSLGWGQNLFPWCSATGQGEMSASWNMGCSIWTWRKISLMWGWQSKIDHRGTFRIKYFLELLDIISANYKEKSNKPFSTFYTTSAFVFFIYNLGLTIFHLLILCLTRAGSSVFLFKTFWRSVQSFVSHIFHTHSDILLASQRSSTWSWNLSIQGCFAAIFLLVCRTSYVIQVDSELLLLGFMEPVFPV